jgi:hypothetical protein
VKKTVSLALAVCLIKSILSMETVFMPLPLPLSLFP